MQETPVQFLSWEDPLEKGWVSTAVFTAFLVAQTVRNLPPMQETCVRSLGWEDPLEEGMATHSSILCWKVPTDKEPGGLQSMRSQRVRHD